MSDDAAFASSLPVLSDFHDVVTGGHFLPVPAGWFIVVTDVVGSTRAIEEGRYRDVNTLGAACIVAAQNAIDGVLLFVFGGDGATFVVGPTQLPRVTKALTGVAAFAERSFALRLRVGVVPVATLLKQGASLEAARFLLVGKKALATFRGGGLALADQLVKEQPEIYLLPLNDPGTADLSGLSCRWQPVPSQRGVVVSLLVASEGASEHGVYPRVLSELEAILEQNLDAANPIDETGMQYKSVRDIAREEARLTKTPWSTIFLARVVQTVAAALAFRWGIRPPGFDPARYMKSMRSHSDFRKFDDGLKMVLDCTAAQADRIQTFLAGEHAAGQLRFGMHRSPTALLTCFVTTVHDGGHIHFVDGSHGGYAMAAKQLKAQSRQTRPKGDAGITP